MIKIKHRLKIKYNKYNKKEKYTFENQGLPNLTRVYFSRLNLH